MSRRVPNRMNRLDEFPPYKGGHTCLPGRYVFEFAPHHPLANGWGWVAQHRLVAEDIAGRRLRRSTDPARAECVHHIDENRTNNDPTNLVVMTKTQHQRHHARRNADRQLARLTVEKVSTALRDRTIREAATQLHCHPQTIRNRFPELIASRKRASPHRIDDPCTAATIRPYAASDRYSLIEASKATNISPITIVSACRFHGISWTHKKRPGRPPRSSPFRTKPRATRIGPAEQ